MTEQPDISQSGLNKEHFKKEIAGKQTKLIILTNDKGVEACLINYGATLVSLMVPNKQQEFDDIVTGFDDIDKYLNAHEIYFGSTIGRYANRIANGKLTINDTTYQLAQNNGQNHLHGGVNAFNKVIWDITEETPQRVVFSYLSPHLEENYPGNLKVEVCYELTDENELIISYQATTDRTTVVNLSHHSFFNLSGNFSNTIDQHLLQVDAEAFTPVDQQLIPTGELALVSGTPFDFRSIKRVGKGLLDTTNLQIRLGKGYDHNFVLTKAEKKDDGLHFAAKVKEMSSGRIMEVWTNEPGIQFYTGNFLNGKDIGKNNDRYHFRTAFCLETQHFPDSPNQEGFPPTLLNPGEKYHSVCKYTFKTE